MLMSLRAITLFSFLPGIFLLILLTSPTAYYEEYSSQPESSLTRFQRLLSPSSHFTQALWSFDDVIGAIEDWIIGRHRERDDGEEDEDDSKKWWRIGPGIGSSIAESSVYVESTNSIHPSRSASFTPSISSPSGLPGFLIPVSVFHPNSSSYGCPPSHAHNFTYHQVPENFIALVKRGKCNFLQKILYAQSLGAIGVVVGDEDKDSSGLLTMFANRIRDKEDIEKVSVPSVFVSGKSRNDLERLWREEGQWINQSAIEGRLRGLKVTMNQDDVWSWPLLDLLLLLLFLPSIMTIVTLILHRIRIARQRKVERAPQEVVDRLEVCIYGEESRRNSLDLEKGPEGDNSTGPVIAEQPSFEPQEMPPSENTPLLGSGAGEGLRRSNWLPRVSLSRLLRRHEISPYSTTSPISIANPNASSEESDPSTSRYVRTPIKRRSRRSLPFSNTCAICLESFENGDLIKLLPCKHSFHAQEVDKWLLTYKKICPSCRHSITSPISSPPRHTPTADDQEASATSTNPSPSCDGDSSQIASTSSLTVERMMERDRESRSPEEHP